LQAPHRNHRSESNQYYQTARHPFLQRLLWRAMC